MQKQNNAIVKRLENTPRDMGYSTLADLIDTEMGSSTPRLKGLPPSPHDISNTKPQQEWKVLLLALDRRRHVRRNRFTKNLIFPNAPRLTFRIDDSVDVYWRVRVPFSPEQQ